MYKRDKLNINQFDGDAERWKTANAKWNRKNWKIVCEDVAAVYSGYQSSDLEFDPLMDSEYRKYGGKLKRIQPTVKALTIAPTDTKSNKDDSIGGLFVGLVLIGFVYYYIRRKQKSKVAKP
ncbi:hypothetical protein GCM10028807_57720 [Spirosoma daeguense]